MAATTATPGCLLCRFPFTVPLKRFLYRCALTPGLALGRDCWARLFGDPVENQRADDQAKGKPHSSYGGQHLLSLIMYQAGEAWLVVAKDESRKP